MVSCHYSHFTFRNKDSIVRAVTGLWAGHPGSYPSRGSDFSPKHADWLWGHPPLFIGYRGSFLGVKWLVCEVNLSTQSPAEVKNEWS